MAVADAGDFDHFVQAVHIGNRYAVVDFDVFGSAVRGAQCLCQVFGNQIARHGNHGSMADGAVGINGNIGRTAADVDDAYAQIFFVFSQNSLTAR